MRYHVAGLGEAKKRHSQSLVNAWRPPIESNFGRERAFGAARMAADGVEQSSRAVTFRR